MANWTDTAMSVILPTKNVDKLTKMFKSTTNDTDDNEGRKFYRTYLIDYDVESNMKGKSLLKMNIECAWSVKCCMLDDYLSQNYITINDVVKMLDVEKLVLYSKEEGVGFEETVIFDYKEDDEVMYDCRDLYPSVDCLYLEEENE